MTDTGRSVTAELELDATIEDAWRALTDARELSRWFPITARVEPGAGGAMTWDWGDRFHWASVIDLWEPPRRLRLVQEVERPRDTEGRMLEGSTIASARMVMDFTLETRKGKTHLRLVHSGFGRGAAWDDELEGVTNGWAYELRSLSHYLARHRGKDRHWGWAMVTTAAPLGAVWRRLVGPDGFAIAARKLEAGEPYTVRLPGGESLSGTVKLHIPEREFFGTVDELDDGVFRLGTWAAGGATGINVWIATYDPAFRGRAEALARAAQGFLDLAFTQEAALPATG